MHHDSAEEEEERIKKDEEEDDDDDDDRKKGEVFHIFLTSNLTEHQLKACIPQAPGVGSDAITSMSNHNSDKQNECNRRKISSSQKQQHQAPTRLAGIFHELDNVFVPLSSILASLHLFQGQFFYLTSTTITQQQQYLQQQQEHQMQQSMNLSTPIYDNNQYHNMPLEAR
eukprot:14010714-Ditylum_brightwellii.AAC.1